MKSRLALVSLVVVATAALAGAQTHRASVRGVVVDPSGAPVPGVRLTLETPATGETREVTTSGEGRFAVPSLAPGRHRLAFALDGYKRHVQEVVLEVGQEIWIEVPLEVGPVSEEVFVVAPLVALDNDSVAMGTVIGADRIEGLPLDGRNFLDLALLVPGAAQAAEGSAASVRGDVAFNVNGAREDANAYLLDGAYNFDPKLNAVGVRPPLDAIREFEVLTSAADASFGRNAGGQINVVTRSGTNRVDGTAYEFFRNGAFDARNAFAPAGEPAPEYARHQFGGSIGGPLVRNRAFFFGDYEGTRRTEGLTRVTSVPTALERAGDFSQSATPPRDPFTGQPFPGNRIPTAYLNPIGVAIANFYPEPNRSGASANVVSSPAARDQEDQFDVRVDYALAPASTLTLRYSFGDRRLYEPFTGSGFAAVPGYGIDVPRRGQNLLATWSQIWSPRLVNEVRVSWSRVSTGVFQENLGTSLNAAVGLPELAGDPRQYGLSFITVGGYSPLGDEYNNPQHSTTNMVQVMDTATWSRGRHLVRAGADVRAIRQNAYRDVQARGFIAFADRGYTGNALADLLLGLPVVTGRADVDNPQRLRTESLNLFVHDSFRIAPTVTLSAGVRYELNSPPVDAADRAFLYDPDTESLVQVGTGGVPRGGYATDWNNVAPRAGVAWTPGGSDRTVVRAGYGVFFDQASLAPSEGLYFNAPYFSLSTYFPLPGLPPLTLYDPWPASFPFAMPQSALTFQRDLATGYLHQWNVNVQRQLGAGVAVEAAYVGSRGRALVAGRDINQPAPSAAQINPRPVVAFDDITAIESRATSRYDALQLRLQQPLRQGMSFIASYTLSKSTDDASSFFASRGDANFPQDSRTLAGEYGRSNFDVRHRLSIAFGCELPFGTGRAWLADRGWLSALVADWEVQGTITLQSGRPFTAALLPDIDNSNTGRSVLGFGANDRPDLAGDPTLANPGPGGWFDVSAFAFPAYGTFGNAGRNILEGPGYQNINLAVLKHVRMTGDARLQLRVEVFNLLNHVNYGLPDNFLGSPTFGQILSAGSPRRVQLGAKILF